MNPPRDLILDQGVGAALGTSLPGTVWIIAAFGAAAVGALVWGWLLVRNHARRLREVFERSPQPMFIIGGPTVRILAANREACRLYGFAPQEWKTLRFADLQAPHTATNDGTGEDSLSTLLKRSSIASSVLIVWPHVRKDGSRIDVEVSGFVQGYPERDSRVVALRDVTALQQEAASKRATEEALRISEARYRQLVEGIDLISWEASLPDYRFTFVSGPAERILGFSAETWYQPDFWRTHLHPTDLDAALEFCVAATSRCEDHAFEYRMIAADGHEVWFRDLVTIVMRDGTPVSLRGALIDITAEKCSLAEIKEAKQRYLAIVDAHPDLICRFTPDSTLTFVNDAYAAFFGCGSARSLVGQKFFEFTDTVHTERVRRNLLTLAEHPGPPEITEQPARGGSGEIRWFSWHNSVVRTESGRGVEFQGVGRDITDLVHARLAVARRDAILRTVAETAGSVLSARRWDDTLPDLLARLGSASGASCLCMVAFTDDSLHPTRTVQCWTDPSQEIGEGCQRLQDGAAVFNDHAEPVMVGRALGVPLLVGPKVWGFLSASPADDRPDWTAGEIDALRSFAGLLGAFMQRERMSEDLRASDEQLRQSQKLEAVGQLASGVAHDFNNLLTAIQGYVGLAKTSLPPNHPAIESLEQVEEASRQATGVAHALLTFTRRGTGQRRTVELGSVVDPALKLLRRTLPASIDLRMEPSEVPLWVDADATQLQQVILNLTINARDAMPTGGVVRVRIEAAGPREAAIIVSDEGTGMSEAVQTRLFEPFFTTKPKGAGTGLGLSIVHGIIAEHGGRIVVRSRPGIGSTFRVFLPIVDAPTDGPHHSKPAAELARGSVLVLEDDSLVRGLMCSMLNSLGYEAVPASNAAAADALVASDRPFTAALIDIELPGRSGADALALWRQQGRTFPAILVTGLAEGKDLGESLAGTAVLQKPFRLSDLRDVLTNISAANPDIIRTPLIKGDL